MKAKIFLLAAFFAWLTGTANAQKFAYVDTDYILNQMTEYKAAQKQLNELSQKWENDLKIMKDEIDKMYKDYRAEEILLSATQKKERENAIVAKEEEMKKFEQEKFGVNGELFKKRQELIKPIQDKVFAAIQRVAKKNGFDFIFDKSANMNILFSNPKYDRSDDVLDELGITQTENPNDK
ncbi:MAG: OmpH family outer membrane protein [Bacteroidetes bacterium]|nr:OmpH family outer membrane protein [Bacteroidota bacterium]